MFINMVVCWILMLLILPATSFSAQTGVPTPKQIKVLVGACNLGRQSTLVAPETWKTRYRAAVGQFEDLLRNLNTPGAAKITVILEQPKGGPAAKKEGFTVNVSASGIVIKAGDPLGALHGLTYVEAQIRRGSGRIRNQTVGDWPDHKVRALHLVLRGQRPEQLKRQITAARFGYFNCLVLDLKNEVRLRSMEKIASPNAWTQAEFVDVVRFARENGLDFVPNLPLLTHQNAFFKNSYPHLLFNKQTYDPRKEETYQVVFPIIDEVIRLTNPKAFHIGHDEVARMTAEERERLMSPRARRRVQRGGGARRIANVLRPGERMLPPELFLVSVTRLHEHLRAKGVETWMWGDMLIAPEEFPSMLDKSIHGIKGYSNLRGRIPKDIVIIDWHFYDKQRDFPSARAFAQAGHKVLGATRMNRTTMANFSRYVAQMPVGGEGMMAATFYGALLRRGMDAEAIVYEIIRDSGEAFWNASG